MIIIGLDKNMKGTQPSLFRLWCVELGHILQFISCFGCYFSYSIIFTVYCNNDKGSDFILREYG